MSSRRQDQKRSRPTLFSIEQKGEICILNFNLTKNLRSLLGMDLSSIQDVWDFLNEQKKRPSKILVISVPPGLFDARNIDEIFREHGIHYPKNSKEVPTNADHKLGLWDFFREENTHHLFIEQIRKIDSFVISSLQGEIVLSLLGPALAFDYRIASTDTVFVNRFLDAGFPPLGALPWFLVQLVGQTEARKILLEKETLSAEEALHLGLVDRIVPPDKIRDECMASAERFAAKPKDTLVGIKHLLIAADQNLDHYLHIEGKRFEAFIQRMSDESI